MKKNLGIILSVLIGMMLFAGCGENITAESDLVYVDKKGGVTSVDVGEFDQSYYSQEELKSFVEEEVEQYTTANGKDTVSLKDLSVENGVAKLTLAYKTVDDYVGFNGIELYQGKVVKALADGYGFDVDFKTVENETVTGTASSQDIYGDSSLKAVIIKANHISVKVPGNVCFVSGDDVELTAADTVSIWQDGTPEDSFETEVYTYIIYK